MALGTQNELRVLVVDEDTEIVRTVCGRLIAHGYDVGTWRHARGLHEAIERTRPDLVLVDVLMPNFNGAALKALLARYPAEGTPAVILHSAVPERTLFRLVDVRKALGVIEKTADDVQFLLAFGTVVDRFLSRNTVAVSGTHRVRDESEPALPDNVVLWTGDTRR